MSPRHRITLVATALVVVAMIVFIAQHLRTGESVVSFMPTGNDAGLGELSRALAESEQANVLVLMVDGPDAQTVSQASRSLAEKLRSNPEVAWLRTGVDEQTQSALYDLYFSRRNAFLSRDPEHELAQKLQPAALDAHAQDVRTELAGPMGSMIGRSLGQDPLLGFQQTLARLQSMQNQALTLHDDQFVTRDGKHAVLFLATRHSSFDAPKQRALMGAIDLAFDASNPSHTLHLRKSGVHVHAVKAEASTRDDIQRISVFSTLGVILLYFFLYRSFRYLLLTFLPIVIGFVVAVASTLAIFGSVHGLTLAFGASLIGVCFDYPVHYLTHRVFSPSHSKDAEKHVWMGLALGAITTIGGLGGLGWASLPGLREIALFSSAGVIGSWVATMLVLPPLTPKHDPDAARLHPWLTRAIHRALRAVQDSPRAVMIVVAVPVALCALGLPHLQWEDSARALLPSDAAIEAEDRAIMELVSPYERGRFIIARGATDEAALQAGDKLMTALERAQADGLITGFRSAHALLWSKDLQARNLAQSSAPGVADRVADAFERAGFVRGAFEPFKRSVSETVAPLTYDDLLRSPLADMIRPFKLRVGNDVAYCTFIAGVSDAHALEQRIAGINGVMLFDQSAFLRTTYASYRARTFELLLVSLPFVFALIYARYRNVRQSLASMLPAILGAAAALALLAFIGTKANMMHVLGVILVLSMGSDYGIFLAEASSDVDETDTTMLSILVACLDTLLSFGLLALSLHPALRAIGLTTGVGILVSAMLAPACQRLIATRSSS